ncbi:hypothetical protein niasHS_014580 [Heterodera schachtii]|uniref:Uncharacterized protein n=1 Tax=Heterodera schachtii TaxID=97005 RepID=A0ABD2IZN2_HETSC
MSKRSKLLLPSLAIVGLLPFVTVSSVFASDDEERLMMDVFKGYNSLILPLRNDSQPITVRMTLQLVLLINVDEKDQIMHTNVWLTLKWKDFQMAWSPVNYGGIKEFRVSPDKVWLPDIVLFNNADGNYEVSFMSNVIIDYRGNVLWVPPAIYKSSCIIDVEYFPFDEQVCHLVFGSWTYNENEIKMEFEQADSMDLSEYAKSVSSIWDVIDAPASLVNRRSRIEYQLRIRRKTLFYTVVLIIPTVLMAFLSMAVFFLPTDSGEKMTLTISVLLSIVVFLLVVSKILPPTSSTIPLISKYLLLTFILNIVTITVTVVIINVYHRGPTTHRMPRWVRFVFLKLMPHLLCMKRPSPAINRLAWHAAEGGDSDGLTTLPGVGQFTVPLNVSSAHHPNCPAAGKSDNKMEQKNNNEGESANEEQTEENDGGKAIKAIPLSAEAVRAVHSIEYITEHMRREEKHKTHRDDWKYVAMVIDRFLLYVSQWTFRDKQLQEVFVCPAAGHA